MRFDTGYEASENGLFLKKAKFDNGVFNDSSENISRKRKGFYLESLDDDGEEQEDRTNERKESDLEREGERKRSRFSDSASKTPSSFTKPQTQPQQRHQRKPSAPLIIRSRKHSTFVNLCRLAEIKKAAKLRPSTFVSKEDQSVYLKNEVFKTEAQKIWEHMLKVFVRIFPDITDIQMEIALMLMRLLLNYIFKEELVTNFAVLRELYGFESCDHNNVGVAITPRRFGKTTMLVAIISTCIICIPRFTHMHMSIDLELAGDFMVEVGRAVDQDPEGSKLTKMGKGSKDMVQYCSPGDPTDIRYSKREAAHEKVRTNPLSFSFLLFFFFFI